MPPLPLLLSLSIYNLLLSASCYCRQNNLCLLRSCDTVPSRLIYDRGKYLAFADKKHKPIPIHYELTPGAIKSIMQYQVAPRSNALIQVKVVNSSQFAGKEVVLSPINEDEHSHNGQINTANCESCQLNPIRNTCMYIFFSVKFPSLAL